MKLLDMHGKLSKNFVSFVLASFIFLSLFSVGIGMEMKDGQMSSCIFTANQASICQMSVTEHISQWQQEFIGVPAKSDILIFALLFLAFVIIPFAKPFSQIKHPEAAVRFLFYRRNTAAKIFNPLLLAFSDGILNPKIYEPSRI